MDDRRRSRMGRGTCMKHRHRNRILTGAMVIAIVGWVAIETFTDESTAPSTRTPAPLTANSRQRCSRPNVTSRGPAVPRRRVAARIGNDLRPCREHPRPRCRVFPDEGHVGRAPRGRGGRLARLSGRSDVRVARSAEANGFSQADAQTRATHVASVALTTEACVGVTPARIEERFGFLDQAVGAGNEQAMIDYRVESPNGRDITTFDPRDPLLTA